MRTSTIAAVLLAAAVSAAPAAQEPSNADALLRRYLQGERTLALPASFDAKAFLASITDAIDKRLPFPPERVRRGVAAFVLETADARLDAGDIPASRTLLEWACARVRSHETVDDFDVAWHAAALSLAESWLDPVALEGHVKHAQKQLPGDPFLALAWAVAAEQRASPLLVGRSIPGSVNPIANDENRARRSAITARLMDDATVRFAIAAGNPRTAADARVRTAHIQLMRDQPQSALVSLAGLETTSREGWVVYLARLFRGQALERLQRPDEAIASFRDALRVGPGGQTATLSLSTLLYRRGQRDEAEALVRQLLADTDPINDPWWTYWAGSARLWTTRLDAMRGMLQ
jgi:tetratricopeptide (TPR) repeat protein